jgi:hypothetical protein
MILIVLCYNLGLLNIRVENEIYEIMKYILIYLCLTLSSTLISFSQDTINQNYFINLKNKLDKDTDVMEQKFLQKKCSKGHIHLQVMFVKYKHDNSARWWQIGHEFTYYENGQLAWISKVDYNTKVLKDTAKTFDSDGNLIQLFIYNDTLVKSVPVKQIYGFVFNFKKYFKNYPDKYKEVIWEKGIRRERNYILTKEDGFQIDGNELYFNRDGTIEKIVKYKEGKLVDN